MNRRNRTESQMRDEVLNVKMPGKTRNDEMADEARAESDAMKAANAAARERRLSAEQKENQRRIEADKAATEARLKDEFADKLRATGIATEEDINRLWENEGRDQALIAEAQRIERETDNTLKERLPYRM